MKNWQFFCLIATILATDIQSHTDAIGCFLILGLSIIELLKDGESAAKPAGDTP